MLSIELKEFLKEELGRHCNIDENTDLEKDCGISGDDAIEFINKFSQVFNVDISSFAFEDYFLSEGFNLEMFFNNLFIPKKIRHRKQLLFSDLEKAIELGKLE